jgi:hypothetical protein
MKQFILLNFPNTQTPNLLCKYEIRILIPKAQRQTRTPMRPLKTHVFSLQHHTAKQLMRGKTANGSETRQVQICLFITLISRNVQFLRNSSAC